jgi:hypothetical protein
MLLSSKIFVHVSIFLTLSFAQNITNVQQKVENGRIIIYFNLEGDGSESFDISVLASKDGKIITPKVIFGDLKYVQSGSNNYIWWEPKLEGLSLSNWDVELSAIPVEFTSIDFVFIPGGTFEMGCGLVIGCGKNEKPLHKVTIRDFLMSSTEVTQSQWKAIMGDNPSQFIGENLPVENVNWNDIQKFLNKLSNLTNKKHFLPSEAQWEYAAREGGETSIWPGTGSRKELQDYSWYKFNSSQRTHNVGTKKPNSYGLYDMGGNVSEWCLDWYDRKYYEYSSQGNPQGPKKGWFKVQRGGNWTSESKQLKCQNRTYGTVVESSNEVGFRVVRMVYE